MATDAFKLGDHEFNYSYSPETDDPLSGMLQENRRPIRGAPPPNHLVGVAVESRGDGPSAALMNGDFCGHGEPTFTVFDIEIDGSREVEIAVEADDDVMLDEEDEEGEEAELPIRRLLARSPRSDGLWTVIHDETWVSGSYPSFPSQVVKESDSEIEPVLTDDGEPELMRLSIGREYPAETESVGDVSWVAVVAKPVHGEDEEDLVCLVSVETM